MGLLLNAALRSALWVAITTRRSPSHWSDGALRRCQVITVEEGVGGEGGGWLVDYICTFNAMVTVSQPKWPVINTQYCSIPICREWLVSDVGGCSRREGGGGS